MSPGGERNRKEGRKGGGGLVQCGPGDLSLGASLAPNQLCHLTSLAFRTLVFKIRRVDWILKDPSQ